MSDEKISFVGRVVKADDAAQVLMGFGNVAVTKDGRTVVDSQNDRIASPEMLQRAVWKFMDHGGLSGEDHAGEPNARVVGSVVLTREVQAAMGIPPGTVDEGWWVEVHCPDRATFERRRKSKTAFSLQGRARRVPKEK